MTDTDKETLIRQYAAGDITWHDLRERGFDDYVQVLGGLGDFGLAPADRADGGAESRGAGARSRRSFATPASPRP